MDAQELLAKAHDVISVSRVYAEPIERDGAIVILAANVAGGGGGGSGTDESGTQGGGSGYGIKAKPAGAWTIYNGEAKWQPALNVNRIVMGFQVLAVTIVLAWWSVRRAKARAA